MGNILIPPKFDKYQVHEYLLIIMDTANNIVVGYINYDPNEGAWFFFVKDFISNLYNNKDTAIEDLCTMYITKRYDKAFSNAGLIENENLVKGR